MGGRHGPLRTREGGHPFRGGPRTARGALAILLAAAALAACGSSGGGDGGEAAGGAEVLQVSGVSRLQPAKGAPVAATVDGMTAFATKLYAAAAEPGENTVLSPLSIAYAFAMARAGAAGDTAAALDRTFGFPGEVAAAFNALTNGLVTASAPPRPTAEPTPAEGEERRPEAPVVAIANGLFTQRGYPILEPFLRTLGEQYGSEVRAVDFADEDAALAAINSWADEHTAGRITKILEHLDPMTRLALLNAVYLKASWTEPFDRVGEKPFDVAGEKVDVPSMSRTVFGGYAEGDGWRALTIPYYGDRLAMRVLVPTGDKEPGDLLVPAVLAAAAKGASKDVHVTLPLWDFGTTLDLRELLKGMGLTVPFDEAEADFSGITTAERLFIDQAVHKANITVDEYGTEAAAVTALTMMATSARAEPMELTVDRPFAFAVVDTKSGAPLFLGHVADPRAS